MRHVEYSFDMNLNGREVYVDVTKMGRTAQDNPMAEAFEVFDRETGTPIEISEEEFEEIQDQSIEVIRDMGRPDTIEEEIEEEEVEEDD